MKLLSNRRGAVSMIMAGAMTVLVGCLALAVDMGSVYLASRRLQGIADNAALAAVSQLADPDAPARASVTDNGWTYPSTVSVVTGTYTPDSSIAPASRFTAGGASVNGVEVTITSQVPVFFAAALTGQRTMTITRKAIATQSNLAAFSIGTRLASLDGGIANALLTALTGSSVNLSVMDYNSLLSANAQLFDFTDALRTRLGVTAGSFDSVLNTSVTTPVALQALADALQNEGQTAAATAVRTVAASTSNSSLPLSQLIDLGPLGSSDHIQNAKISVSAWDFANAILTLAQGGRQVTLNLGANIPGIATTSVRLAIGQRQTNTPWLAVTPEGQPVITTAQTRLLITSSIGANSALQLLGVGGVSLPVYVQLAQAQASLSSINCPSGPSSATATLSVAPSIGTVAIANVDTSHFNDFTTPLTTSPATLASLGLVSVSGSATAAVGGTTWQSVSFDMDDVDAGTIKQVSTGDVTSSLVSSLASTIALKASIGPLTVSSPTLTSGVAAALTPVAPSLDSAINSLTGLLGLHLGQADLRMNGIRCGVPALVA